MANKVILSEQFKLQLRDFVIGAIMAVVASLVPLIEASVSAGELTFNWKLIGLTALGAFTAYIGKKFLETPKVTTVYKTNDKAAEVAQTLK